MNLKELRKRAKLNQTAAADALEVTQSAISHWECGRHRPRVGQLSKLAQLYLCSAEELLGATERSQKKETT